MNSVIRRPKAVLFDHDGVLVSSEALHFEAWRKLLASIGLSIDAFPFHSFVGRTSPQILRHILDQSRPGWTEAEYPLDALALRKNDFYLESAATGLGPYPGVMDGLVWLKANGIRAAVVSNAKRREIEFSVKTLKIRPHFEHLFSRDDVPHPKPHPSAFLTAVQVLGLEPADCLAIDDSPVGLESALMGGIPSASVTTNYPASALESPIPGRPDLKPVWIGASMEQFFNWLKSLPTS